MYSPIEEMLNSYAAKNTARFHMPGHKGSLNSLDVTEISATDNLLTPGDALALAQQQAAEAFGAAQTLFCTCGATAGVIAMLLALPRGSRVALYRHCHRSAANGIALGGHTPLWVNDDTVYEVLLRQKPDALLVTSPDYFGNCADLPRLSAACRQNGALLLVDEAHGAHFALSEALPESAANYACMWVDSAHKTLCCTNQGAYLHLCRADWPKKPTPQRLKEALFTIHTTSPSFPLLMELDKAWRIGLQWDYKKHIQRLEGVAKAVRTLGLTVAKNDDPTRFVIDVSARCSGYEAAARLEQAGVYMEMADRTCLVAITTPADPDEWYDRLIAALGDLQGEPVPKETFAPLPPLPPVRMKPWEAAFGPVERVPLAKALGKVAAVPVGVYPPGSAVVAAGEEFTRPCIDHLLSGGELFGVDDGWVTIVKSDQEE